DENFNKEIKESIDKHSTSEPITDIYKQYIEIKFVQDAEDFYRQQKILCLESNSIMEDLTQISKNFDEEINFVKFFLPKFKSTFQMLINNINTIEKISETAINDPNLYIETIFDIYERFVKLFCTEPSFNIALDKACCKFINNNAVTEKSGTTTKSAELLARYCDALLKKAFATFDSNLIKKN
ncbi:unnamed protein product, partial [Rotaria sp. Silwood2]